MKLHFKIPQGLKKHVTDELLKSKETFRKGELQTSWRHLEKREELEKLSLTALVILKTQIENGED